MRVVCKILYGICILSVLLILAGACLRANPPVYSDQYTSAHDAVTMAPLIGFSAEGLINSGDDKALDTLPGIGEIISQRMIEVREMLGGFRLPEDLLLVKGIGEKKLDGIMDSLAEPLVELQELID